MNKRYILLCVPVLMAGAAWYFWDPPKVATERAKPTLSVENLVRAPRARPLGASQGPAANQDRVSPKCREQWDLLSGVDLRRFQEDAEVAIPTAVAEACSKDSLPPNFSGPLKMFQDSCLKLGSHPSPEQRAVCYQSMVFLRAMVSDFDSQNQTAESISDPRLLADKLIASLFSDVTEGLPYAQKLLEKDPNSAPVAKIAAVLEMVSLDSGKTSVSPESAGRALERALRLDPNNAPFYEKLQNAVDLAAAPNDEARVGVAKQISQSEPPTPQKTYLASYVAFKERRFSDAAGLLSEALRADPRNPDYLQTQKELASHLKRKTPQLETQKLFNHSYQLDLGALVP